MVRTCLQYLCVLLVFFIIGIVKISFINMIGMTPMMFNVSVLYCSWFLGRWQGLFGAFLACVINLYVVFSLDGNTTIAWGRLSCIVASLFGTALLVDYIKVLSDSRRKWSESQRQILGDLENLDNGLAYVSHDDEFKILTWSKGAEEMTGYTAEETFGSSIHKFFTDEDIRANTPEQLVATVKERGFWRGELRAVRKNGSHFWVSLLAVRLKVGFMVIAWDISEQKSRQDSLQKWKHIFDHGGWAACVIDVRTNFITHVNPAFVEMHGYSHSEELVRKPLTILFPPEFVPKLPRQLRDANVKNDYICETLHIRKNGTRFPVQINVNVFKDELEKPIYRVVICQDITQQRKTERQLRHTTEELRLSVEKKDAFLATLAHELRNPLQPIKTVLHMYGESQTIDQKMMELIARNVDQIQSHVDDLMDIASIGKGKIQLKKKNFDLRDTVHLAVEQVHPLIKAKNHKLYISVPTEPVVLNADVRRIQQIITNLLNNAAKYTDDSGKIWITIEAQDHQVLVNIKDNGMGITSELLPDKIFEMYVQDRTQTTTRGGLGLGLTIVKTLVDLHGGDIEVESEIKKGSIFKINLPIGEQVEVNASAPVEPFNKSFVDSDRKILVVDDNVDAATSLQMMFAMDGCNVVVVHDGEEAIKTFRNFHPDIILLDIGLPKIDGYEVAKRIRAVSHDVTIIAVTGYGQPADMQRSTEAGFDDHVVKPVEPHRFKTLVNNTFEAKSKRSSHAEFHS